MLCDLSFPEFQGFSQRHMWDEDCFPMHILFPSWIRSSWRAGSMFCNSPSNTHSSLSHSCHTLTPRIISTHPWGSGIVSSARTLVGVLPAKGSITCWLNTQDPRPACLGCILALSLFSRVSAAKLVNFTVPWFLLLKRGGIMVSIHRALMRTKWVNTRKVVQTAHFQHQISVSYYCFGVKPRISVLLDFTCLGRSTSLSPYAVQSHPKMAGH